MCEIDCLFDIKPTSYYITTRANQYKRIGNFGSWVEQKSHWSMLMKIDDGH